MSNENNKVLLYQTEDGGTKLSVVVKDGNAWLTQAQMAELFQREKSVISRHLSNLFATGELVMNSVVAKTATTAKDGKVYEVTYYGLEATMAVGFRVNSHRGIQFGRSYENTISAWMMVGLLRPCLLGRGGRIPPSDFWNSLPTLGTGATFGAKPLTQEQRTEIARNAVRVRWAKVKGTPTDEGEQVSGSAVPVFSGAPASIAMGLIYLSQRVIRRKEEVEMNGSGSIELFQKMLGKREDRRKELRKELEELEQEIQSIQHTYDLHRTQGSEGVFNANAS